MREPKPKPQKISFQVSDLPPWKQTSKGDRKEKQKRVKSLKCCAKSEIEKFNERLRQRVSIAWINPMDPQTMVHIFIHYTRGIGKSDATNIIGGIADALQGILYENDRQIRKVAYTEDSGASDEYRIIIRYTGPPSMRTGIDSRLPL